MVHASLGLEMLSKHLHWPHQRLYVTTFTKQFPKLPAHKLRDNSVQGRIFLLLNRGCNWNKHWRRVQESILQNFLLLCTSIRDL